MSSKNNASRSRLVLSTALSTILMFSYSGRKSYAGGCYGSNGVIECSGETNISSDSIQNLSNASEVTTSSDFGINTILNGYDAVVIRGSEETLKFIDINNAVITGSRNGLVVANGGTGETTVTSTGFISGMTGVGLTIYNTNTTSNVSATVNNVFGQTYGIYSANFGNGSTNLQIHGTVSSSDFAGIGASNNGTDLTISANNVSGVRYGALVRSQGSGNIDVSISGHVSASEAQALRVVNSAAGRNINLAVTSATAHSDGISVSNSGNGSTNITSSGTITGNTGVGISAYNTSSTTGLIISSNNVIGKTYGIYARNNGSGETSITTSGLVVGENLTAIGAFSEGADIAITLDDAQGKNFGVYTNNLGTGETTINSSGLILATNGQGIKALNSATATDINLETVSVIGTETGISIANQGKGETNIVSSGFIAASEGAGISVVNSGTNLNINANQITGSDYGIHATNRGSGNTAISTTEHVVGGVTGLAVSNQGRDLAITAVDVSGGQYGIYAHNSGSGQTSLSISGDVSGLGSTGIGVVNHGTDLSLTTNDVAGDQYGVSVSNLGSGSTSVTANGRLESQNGVGINAVNNGEDLAVSAVNISGASYGVYAHNKGSGDTEISLTGDVIGENAAGVRVVNEGGDLSLSANNVTGGRYGISLTNHGNGSTTAVARGRLTSQNGAGFSAVNSGQNLTISTLDVSGATYGVFAHNKGSGEVSVHVSGDIVGERSAGIDITNDGTDLNLSAENVSGGQYGAAVSNTGIGSTIVTLNGSLRSQDGIGLKLSSKGADVDISLKDVFGASNGISVSNLGSGSTQITLDGTIEGGTAAAIDTSGNQETFTSIVLRSGTDVYSQSGIAIQNDHGNSNTIIQSNSIVRGQVLLGEGQDRVDIQTGGIFDPSRVPSFALTGDVTNNGLLTFHQGTTDNRLTIVGDYQGNGEIELEVDLAEATADVLTVDGNILGGTTRLALSDISNSEIADFQDILLVDVTGNSTSDAFVADSFVLGAYQIGLGQIGDDWYLRNFGYSNTAAVAEALPTVLLSINTITESTYSNYFRLKDQVFADKTHDSSDGFSSFDLIGPKRAFNVWARADGAEYNIEPDKSSAGNSKIDLQAGQVTGGFDLEISGAGHGKLFAGIAAEYTTANAGLSSDAGFGSVRTNQYGIGLNAAWFDNSGIYLDGRARYLWTKSDISSVSDGLIKEKLSGKGYSLSLEAGKRLQLGKQLFVTPSARVTYASVDFDGFEGPNSENIRLISAKSLRGLVGARIEKSAAWRNAHTGKTNLSYHGLVNLQYEFLDGSEVKVANSTLISEPENLSLELGAGANLSWQDGKYLLAGQVRTTSSVGGSSDNYGVKGNLSFSIKF